VTPVTLPKGVEGSPDIPARDLRESQRVSLLSTHTRDISQLNSPLYSSHKDLDLDPNFPSRAFQGGPRLEGIETLLSILRLLWGEH
jgi:hypothetical protein